MPEKKQNKRKQINMKKIIIWREICPEEFI